MRSKHIPSREMFLVRTGSSALADARKKLARMGRLEDAQQAGGIVIRLDHKGTADPRHIWQQIQSEAGEVPVDPVLLDEAGGVHYPTGEVVIRFKEPPSDAFLAGFAKKFGLTVRQRNAYVPSQIAFHVVQHGYLPDLVESVEAIEEVQSAWANTKSHYQRA
ncbi:MAG: hypothetical protein JNL98_14785 [Bryobacterales bacterium]|nr:hypothetical protein [Bryobacterales bacterium]